jgi:hypothetical protein
VPARSTQHVARTTGWWGKVPTTMLASLLILADAAEEGRKVVLAMLVVGLIFIAVIALGELTHHLAVKRKERTPSRTL